MANISGYTDTTDGQMAEDRSALPGGTYEAAIAKSENKPTKKGDGSYIELEYEVQEGEHKGRRFWHTLNLENPNAQAVEIANRDLNSICHACGKLRASVQDTEELHGIPMLVTLGQKTDSYGTKNVVRGHKPLGAGARAHASQNGQAGGGRQSLMDKIQNNAA